jgi:uncharacterized membrane protein
MVAIEKMTLIYKRGDGILRASQSFESTSIMARHKTLTFALLHMTVAFGVVSVLTGNLAIGGAAALIEPAINTVAYFFHEKAWERRAVPARHQTSSYCATAAR